MKSLQAEVTEMKNADNRDDDDFDEHGSTPIRHIEGWCHDRVWRTGALNLPDLRYIETCLWIHGGFPLNRFSH